MNDTYCCQSLQNNVCIKHKTVFSSLHHKINQSSLWLIVITKFCILKCGLQACFIIVIVTIKADKIN